jgi:hypothetical protein
MFSYYIAGKYNILTFDEFILIALHADRVVGIYPEIKNPIFINQHVGDFNLTNSLEHLVYLRNEPTLMSTDFLNIFPQYDF